MRYSMVHVTYRHMSCIQNNTITKILIAYNPFQKMSKFTHTCRCTYSPLLSQAVDHFFSVKTSQKQDVKALQIVSWLILVTPCISCVVCVRQQKGALKKLEFIKSDHQKRISALKMAQVTTP